VGFVLLGVKLSIRVLYIIDCPFVLCPLYCQSFFDLRLLIAPLVSLNFLNIRLVSIWEILLLELVRIYWFRVWVMEFNATFNNISVIRGGNRSTMGKPPTRRKSLTNCIT
jgi:hypothetical protein